MFDCEFCKVSGAADRSEHYKVRRVMLASAGDIFGMRAMLNALDGHHVVLEELRAEGLERCRPLASKWCSSWLRR